MKRIVCILLITIVFSNFAEAQRILHGHVYGGMSSSSPVDSIKVSSGYGKTDYTQNDGSYIITVDTLRDTLFFSYQGRELTRFTVTKTTPDKLDVYLNNPNYFKNETAHNLPQVTVHAKNYHDDSLRTRDVYSKVFNYKKPTFKYGKDWIIIPPIFIGVDIDNLIYLTQVATNNRKNRYKKFAWSSESEGYVNSRFTRSLVGSLTRIDDDSAITVFINYARPNAMQLKSMNDLELDQYILDKLKEYNKQPMKK